MIIFNLAARRFLAAWQVVAVHCCVGEVLTRAEEHRAVSPMPMRRDCADMNEMTSSSSCGDIDYSAIVNVRDGCGEAMIRRPPRLFSPCSAARRCIKAMQMCARDGCERRGDGGDDEVLIAVDLACGSGRDIVYVAEEVGIGSRRWRFVGVDHCRKHGDALAMIAARRGVSVAFVTSGDLRRAGEAERVLDEIEARIGGSVAMVMMSRFLDRGLLTRMAARLVDATRRPQGAVLVTSQFENLAACVRHGHPTRERDVLRDNELESMMHAWNTTMSTGSRCHGIDAPDDTVDGIEEEGADCASVRSSRRLWRIECNGLKRVADGSERTTREFVATSGIASACS